MLIYELGVTGNSATGNGNGNGNGNSAGNGNGNGNSAGNGNGANGNTAGNGEFYARYSRDHSDLEVSTMGCYVGIPCKQVLTG